MSAIGSYCVLKRSEWPTCLSRAQAIHEEKSGAWIFTQTRVVGREAFDDAWNAASVREVVFDYSGYVLGHYLEAQQELNGLRLVDEEAEAQRALSQVFTAGFLFETRVTLPDLDQERLREYCRSEYDEDGDDLIAPINAAHAFYARGIAEITGDHVVVFVIA